MSERLVLVLAPLAGEAMQALGAAVDLLRLQAVSAFAFPGGILASALRADGIWMDDGGGWHGLMKIGKSGKERCLDSWVFAACAFSEQEVGGPVNRGSRILQGPGYPVRCGSRILRRNRGKKARENAPFGVGLRM